MTWPPTSNSCGPNPVRVVSTPARELGDRANAKSKNQTITLTLTTKEENNSDGFSARHRGVLWPVLHTAGSEKLHSRLLQNPLCHILPHQSARPRHRVLELGSLPPSLALSPFHFHMDLYLRPTPATSLSGKRGWPAHVPPAPGYSRPCSARRMWTQPS